MTRQPTMPPPVGGGAEPSEPGVPTPGEDTSGKGGREPDRQSGERRKGKPRFPLRGLTAATPDRLPLVRQRVIVMVKSGLHLRAACQVAKTAQQFTSRVIVAHGLRRADAKRVLPLLLLGAGHGARLLIQTRGRDAERAMVALTDLSELITPIRAARAARTHHRPPIDLSPSGLQI